MRSVHLRFAALLSLLATTTAEAEIWTTTCKDTFLARAGTVTKESFESLPSSGSTSYTEIPASDLSGHFRLTTNRFMQIWNDPTHATDGNQVLFWHTYSAPPYPGTATITFDNFNNSSAQIKAFGLHIIDWGSSGTTGQLTLETSAGDSYTIDVVPPNLPDWSTFFFGIVSDLPFTRVHLRSTTEGDWVLHDEVYYGSCSSCVGVRRFYFKGTLSADCPLGFDDIGFLGGTISGSWVFSEGAVGHNVNPKVYPLLSFQFKTSNGFTGSAGPGTNSTISIANNVSTPAKDGYTIGIAADYLCSPDKDIGQIWLQMLDDQATVFADTSLPLTLTLSRFESRKMGMLINFDGFGYREACWELTYLSSSSLVKAASDFDSDADVDLADFGRFQSCFNGPNRPLPPPPSCSVDADLDGDGDADLADFQMFQGCFNGPNRRPACM
jgi:hypothetical protein